jgi:type IV pilus assembly protein PilB
VPTLTEILILHGALPIEDIDTLLAGDPADESAVRALVDRGALTELQFARARAEQANVPFVELLDYPITRQALALVPASICVRHQVLPLAIENDRLVLAMVDPRDVFALDDVSRFAHLRVTIVVAERGDLLSAVTRSHRADDELNDLTSTIAEEKAASASAAASAAAGAAGPEAGADDAPIVRFVNLLVSQAIQDQASDIHIEPGEHELGVRYRIDGVLHEMQSAPRSIQNGIISRLKIMSDIDIAERRKPQDGRMSVTHNGRAIDLRVATLPTVWGEKVVLRILDNATTRLTLRDLNLLEHNHAAYEASYQKPYGMILVTGPTGSGKSTTLYTTLHEVARREINVITVEDPVEYRMKGINQVQVNPKAGLTFASALRAILRSDPDVVLLGEIRDHETAQIAIEASLTGHLVLSTLHTNDAPSAITRLTEMGIEPFLVGSALDCVVAQRLARRLCDRCKKPVNYSPDRLAAVGFGLDAQLPARQLYRPDGCANCSHTGYRGRLAIHEVMTVTEEIERLTVARASSATIARAACEGGMLTLREDGWEKVRLGLTSIDEILRVVA